MGYLFDDGISDGSVDDGNYYEPPLPDNSNGSPDMQPSNPTGNGFGTWIAGNLGKALDYAIARDAQSMQMRSYDPRRGYTVNGGVANQGILGDRQLMFIGLGVVLFLLVSKK